MFESLYQRLLEAQITKNKMPSCIAIVISSGDLDGMGIERLNDLLRWSDSVAVSILILYVNDDTPELNKKIRTELKNTPADISLHTAQGVVHFGKGGRIKMVISLGFGGKREVTEAIRSLIIDVQEGRLLPEEIDEKAIEAQLRFHQRPDLVIRAGGKQLTDFMIWQAAYSELYFTDVNWRSLRKIDYLRAIRDWQRRERRFGR